MNERSGFDDFRDTLKRYRELLLWAAASSSLLPLAAYETDIIPSWPKSVVVLTGMVQLVVMIVTFQVSQKLRRDRVKTILLLVVLLLSIAIVLYFVSVSQLEFVGGAGKERLLKGLVCSDDAMRLPRYASKCPLLNDDLISHAENVDDLWTDGSITASRIIVLTGWLLSYAMFVFVIVTFIVFQSQSKGKFLGVSRPEKSVT